MWVEGEREEAGAARLIVTKMGRNCMGGGGGKKVGMALLGWDSLLQCHD